MKTEVVCLADGQNISGFIDCCEKQASSSNSVLLSVEDQKRKRMREAVSRLTDYMKTYDQQAGYEDYTDETFINNVLYGLGIALDKDKYFAGQGFDAFKSVLRKHLDR